MASDSMREDPGVSQLQLVSPSFPKTVGCQTEEEEEEVVVVEKQGEVVAGRFTSCWRSLVCATLLLILVVFTFLGALEIEGVTYYPITWYPLRYLTEIFHTLRRNWRTGRVRLTLKLK